MNRETLEALATLACQRKKREECPCPSCRARRLIFGENVPVQTQETRRTALSKGIISSLKEELPSTEIVYGYDPMETRPRRL